MSEISQSKDNAPGLENTVGPPNDPSNIRIGVRTKRGPISTSVVAGDLFMLPSSALIVVASFSTIFVFG